MSDQEMNYNKSLLTNISYLPSIPRDYLKAK